MKWKHLKKIWTETAIFMNRWMNKRKGISRVYPRLSVKQHQAPFIFLPALGIQLEKVFHKYLGS